MKNQYIFSLALFFAMAMSFISCGGSDGDSSNNPSNPTTSSEIALSSYEAVIVYGGSQSISVSGVNATECTVTISDDYVAYASTSRNSVNIVAKHVGKTDVTLSLNGKSSTIKVVVNPTVNIIGTPCTAFGKNKAYVRSNCVNVNSYGIKESDNSISYTEGVSDGGLSIFHYYTFSSGTLSFIHTYSGKSRLSTSTYHNRFRDIMDQYATWQEDYYSRAFGGYIYLYKRSSDYYIGLREYGSSNDKGWHICYAKTIDEILEELDKNKVYG